MVNEVNYDHYSIGDIDPISDHIIVHNIESTNQRVQRGIIILDENSNERGVRPRWAQVYKVGPEQEDVVPGEWVLVEHGRWTRGIKLDNDDVYRKIDPKAILLVSDLPLHGDL